ncbi:TIGR00296 family protein [Methanococcoides orientis]|uniref:TIGR00296 family protein n=1 Tax=Methanococcoides orientis TaxID=2822137 RepID=UPI001E3A144C|nr:TIGR00296 family protein [Methanococcoides orientis]UGV40071.1 TIGR00296 family protein [Methanococcoides orientis]
MLSDSEGRKAVSLARDTIELFLENGKKMQVSDLPEVFNELRGVFVTLTIEGDLRGCIGHPYPDSPLSDAIIDSAISAATRDPRFPAVGISEMGDIVVEVTILTQPELIDVPPQKLPEVIEVGRHGLIAKDGPYQGLLLPQVAPENDFDAIEFLSHTCLKAGLAHDAWLTGAQMYWFEGQIFKEMRPRGDVEEEKFNSCCK